MSDHRDWPVAEVLAGTIVGEAASETRTGQVAIGCVIRNRVRIAKAFFRRTGKPYWWAACPGIPADWFWHSVMLKPWQFTCWTDSLVRINSNRERGSASWAQATAIAGDILTGEQPDVTLGADHYYARHIPAPAWARGREPVIEIGAHRFYRLV